MKIKKVLFVDLILIVVTLMVIGIFLNYNYFDDSIQLSPSSNILFSFNYVEKIEIANNLGFVDREIVSVFDGKVIRLEQGIWYWKFSERDVKEFNVEDDVELMFRMNGERVEVVVLNGFYEVDKYEYGDYRERVILGSGE